MFCLRAGVLYSGYTLESFRKCLKVQAQLYPRATESLHSNHLV